MILKIQDGHFIAQLILYDTYAHLYYNSCILHQYSNHTCISMQKQCLQPLQISTKLKCQMFLECIIGGIVN